MGLPDINFPLQNKQCPQPRQFLYFPFVLFVAVFLKVYKCERKFSKLVGKIKPAFLRKTFDFLSETKDKRSKALSYVWPKEISSKQHFQYFGFIFNALLTIKLGSTRHHSPFLLHFPFLARFCIQRDSEIEVQLKQGSGRSICEKPPFLSFFPPRSSNEPWVE